MGHHRCFFSDVEGCFFLGNSKILHLVTQFDFELRIRRGDIADKKDQRQHFSHSLVCKSKACDYIIA